MNSHCTVSRRQIHFPFDYNLVNFARLASSFLTPASLLNATVTCKSSPEASQFITMPSPKVPCNTFSPALYELVGMGGAILFTTLLRLVGDLGFTMRLFDVTVFCVLMVFERLMFFPGFA